MQYIVVRFLTSRTSKRLLVRLVDLLFHHRKEVLERVAPVGAVALCVAAFLTFVSQDVLPFLNLRVHGLHHSTTPSSPIPGIDVNVLAPETVRAVIGVAVTLNAATALLTHKIFDSFLKLFHISLCRIQYGSISFYRDVV